MEAPRRLRVDVGGIGVRGLGP